MNELRMTEVLAAPLHKVYAAWSEAEQLRRWFGPGDLKVPEATVDLRPGGRYRIVMQRADGTAHIIGGEYREIRPNECLRFSWQWEGSPAVTEVELRFRALDAGRTELTVIHTEFPNADMCDKHHSGWSACLASLQKYLAAA